MLDDLKNSYVECANQIDNWKKLSIDELANTYIDTEDDDIKSACFSALVCKHWSMLRNYYYKQPIKTVSEEECHDWIVDGILAALDDKVWTIESSKMYKDPKGAEKAMKVCIASIRANYYQYMAYDKRSLNYNSLSLDVLEENSSDGFFIPYHDTYDSLDDYVDYLVVKFFKEKNYLMSYFYDALFNFLLKEDFSNIEDLHVTKIVRYINSITEEDLVDFSNRYKLKLDEVKSSYFIVKNLPRYKLQADVINATNYLKKDKILYDLLKDS